MKSAHYSCEMLSAFLSECFTHSNYTGVLTKHRQLENNGTVEFWQKNEIWLTFNQTKYGAIEGVSGL